MGTTVFRGIRARDIDAGVNGLVEYFVVDSKDEKSEENGFGIFTINFPHHGAITLNRTLDYEKSNKYYVTVVASVSLALPIFSILPIMNFVIKHIINFAI